MNRIAYYLVRPLMKAVGFLPLPLLYRISDFLYLLVYYVVGYRKKIVKDNLSKAFPNKTDAAITALSKKSLRHFCDFLVEMIKGFQISEAEIRRRYYFKDTTLLDNMKKANKSFFIMSAHYANWEWTITIPLYFKPLRAVYAKIQNPYFEKMIKENRSRFGFEMVPNSQSVRQMMIAIPKGDYAAYLMLSDQSPQDKKNNHYTTFLNQEVPVHTGVEQLARKFDMPLIFMKVKRVKRGYYEVAFEMICDTPRDVPPYELTERYLRKVEDLIATAPAYYLWTHRRFKHVR